MTVIWEDTPEHAHYQTLRTRLQMSRWQRMRGMVLAILTLCVAWSR